MAKVKTGQKFKVKAMTWNSFIDAAEYVKKRQADVDSSATRKDTKSGILLVRNNTGDELAQFTIVSLGELIITPSENEQDFRNKLPVFEAELITENNKDKPFVILQRPLQKKEVGAGMLTGITPVKMNVQSEEHEFAELDVSGLKSSDSGSIRILWKGPETGEDKWVVILLGASTAGFIYDGYFAVTNVSDEEAQKIKMSFGEAIINNVLFDVPEMEITITGISYLYLKSTYSGGTIGTPVTESTAEFPSLESGVFKGLIAIIEWDEENAKIKKITQQQFGVMYGIIWGNC